MKSTSTSELQYLYTRLDQIRMSDYERLRARASLARGDAIATLILSAFEGAGRLLKTLVVRPIRRLATSLG
jgi:hypothetical protein